MRILLVATKAGRNWQALLGYVCTRTEASIDLVCARRCPGDDQLIDLGISVHQVPVRRKLDFRSIAELRAIIREGRYDLVHAVTGKTLACSLLATSRLRPSPVIVGYRGVTKPLARWDPSHWLTFWHPRLAGVMCISQAVRDSLAKSGVTAELPIIPRGIATPKGASGRQTLSEFGITEKDFVVGTVATIRPVKGVDVLLRALGQLADLENLKVLLVGEVRDSLVRRLLKDPRIARHVVLAGHRSDAARLVSGLDVYVQPSRSEGLGKALMEAMLQGVCPVITRVGGMVELVESRREGLVVDPEDPSQIAEAIRFLYHHPEQRSRMGNSARQRIQRDFSDERMAEDVVQFYRDLLEQRCRQRRGA